MKNKVIIISTLVGALALGTVALAHPGEGPEGGRGGGGFLGHRIGKLIQRLDLTDTQEDLAIDIRSDLKKEGRALKRAGFTRMNDLSAELAKPKPDAARLKQIADQMLEEQRKLVHTGIDRYLQLHATFSNEQRQRLVEQLKRGQERAKKMMDE
ncbi:MAG: periplasmic heavy metal sensor [Deltaproteobacteria bacterium]|nr:periplasmic heavy metal sensor [Deltaproteobacteria bacterium]